MPRGVYPRHRRSILHDTPNEFLGWKAILSWHDTALQLDRVEETNEHSLYFVVLFETGGRMNEVLLLRPEQIKRNEDAIKIENMEVLKRRVRFTRDVLIKIDDNNPLAKVFVEFVEECKTKYLLPAYTRFSRRLINDRHTSASTVYNKVRAIHPNVWPHLLRDQRAYHLHAPIAEGGRGLDPYEHRAWFEWARMEMPLHYVGRRSEKDLTEALGIKKVPK